MATSHPESRYGVSSRPFFPQVLTPFVNPLALPSGLSLASPSRDSSRHEYCLGQVG